jgi:hypothetical protein
MKIRAFRAFAPQFLAGTAFAWDHPGHSMVNEVALNSLPADFPAFVRERTNTERIKFLAGEPDRWSHAPDMPVKHADWLNHFLDVEQIPTVGLDLAKLPALRYQFAAQFLAARAANADKLPPEAPPQVPDIVPEHTREWCGFLPWEIVEQYGRLKAAFASWQAYEQFGTPEEAANGRADIINVMGLMGHYVGDASEPLHATVHHSGWSGDNPKDYTKWFGIHSWIDSGLIRKAHITSADLTARVAPAQPLPVTARADGRDPIFVAALDFIIAQNQFVEPIYRMEKEGRLGNVPPGQPDRPVSPEARELVEGQLLKGGQLLGALWLTAWKTYKPDAYLIGVLQRRQKAQTPATKP